MTAEMPPPSGPPQAPPTPASQPATATVPVPQAGHASPPVPPPPYALQPGQPGQPALPGPASPPAGATGANGLAIAALCCGLGAFIPLVGVVAVILGVIALQQLRSGFQRGRGMAITGIVLGGLGTLAWAAGVVLLIVSGATAQPERNASGTVTGQAQVMVYDLKAGDCFSGGRADNVDVVTVIPCSAPHESQVVITFQLPDGSYPVETAVVRAARKGCTDKADPLVTDEAMNDQGPSFIYPEAPVTSDDRTVICLIEPDTGTTTGSALK